MPLMTNALNGVPEITLGWRLRMSLERAGIKADDMAKRLGVHRGTVTRWTHDIGAQPRGIYLERWAEITEVPLAWLKGPDTPNEAGRITRHISTLAAAA